MKMINNGKNKYYHKAIEHNNPIVETIEFNVNTNDQEQLEC
jgi:hypothetical protein